MPLGHMMEGGASRSANLYNQWTQKDHLSSWLSKNSKVSSSSFIPPSEVMQFVHISALPTSQNVLIIIIIINLLVRIIHT